MSWLTSADTWVALLTLTLLEIVLGIDNVVFIAILTGALPPRQQAAARRLGLTLALGSRVLLLLALAWVIHLTAPLVTVAGRAFSGRDLLLIGGGLFLLAKSTDEIHDKLEGAEGRRAARTAASYAGVLAQIVLLDVVFSLDSVITAVGMASQVGVMVAAIVIAVGVMLVAVEAISTFVNRHPTVKILALSFLLLIGMALVADGMAVHIPRGYLYFAMGFAVFVELLNLRLRRPAEPEPPNDAFPDGARDERPASPSAPVPQETPR